MKFDCYDWSTTMCDIEHAFYYINQENDAENMDLSNCEDDLSETSMEDIFISEFMNTEN